MIYDIIDRYQAIFIDAYGILVDASGALEGAIEFIDRINQLGKNYLIVTNDASRSHKEISLRFLGLGIEITEDKILCSGSLIVDYFATHQLSGARTRIMGTKGSVEFAHSARAELVNDQDDDFDVLILADESGYRFRESIDHVVSQLIRLIDKNKTPRLILPNPDLIYPKAGTEYGITAGSIGLMIESILAQRYGEKAELKFERLGKPEAWIYEAACKKANTKDALMIGDQMQTDILGAHNFGIDSLLLLTGLTQNKPGSQSAVKPTYVLSTLS